MTLLNRRAWGLLFIAAALAGACYGETTDTIGSETNWLDPCSGDEDCSEGRCLCGVCTEECSEVAGCNDGTLLCASNQSLAHGKLCAEVSAAPEGLCLLPCDGLSCPAANHCEDGACVPDALVPGPQRCDTSVEPQDAGCALANSQSGCYEGFCWIWSCDINWDNCDRDHSNGCETNIAEGDVLNCGTCGRQCDAEWPHVATQLCAEFQCGIATCEAGWDDCDDTKFNGCEVELATDAEHCGECGNACVEGETCNDGTCE